MHIDNHPLQPNVVVVGAGIAGLTAAHELKQRGIHVVVVEADNRVGGRMTSDSIDGHILDRGAQFLSTEYATILQLLHETGLSEQIRPTSHYSAIIRGGSPRKMRADRPLDALKSGLLSWRAWLRFGWNSFQAGNDLRKRSLSDYSQWAAFDQQSVSDWMRHGAMRDVVNYLFEPMLQGFYFQTPEETSQALGLVLTAFGFRRSKTLTLNNGLGSLPEALAANLDVRLNTPVSQISFSDDKVVITTSSGHILADRAILAVPAPIALRMLDAPLLDTPTRHLLETPYTSSINVGLITDEEFALPEELDDVYGMLIPRSERIGIAAIGIENNKRLGCRVTGHLLNMMFCHDRASRLMSLPAEMVVAEAVRNASHYFPTLAQHVTQSRVYRWPAAEPCSNIGRAINLRRYRDQCARQAPSLLLAGDYMSMPFTEGAAESGLWAAELLTRNTFITTIGGSPFASVQHR
ncbi:NAD(P)/FAD-dependent oxidoreductase [Pseudogulbenkiania sp. MAI-1]|uniref:protoporphyrinogen/coproporphyrinogen oxidase n=1 Tax=Pseudogulbenkiania sp. MAI-1 TaxID=990370 RepID=UPI00045E5D81|nr:NAD(P)/FAD-dependent oxidoreductase [Pseudogulbenkiania sp. MAI-1]